MELKPCPFCGGRGEFHPQEHHMDSFWDKNTIVCLSCGYRMEDTSKYLLIRKWNRRTTDDKRDN